MSSYRQILYHIVFATKYREATLCADQQHQLYQYITGVVRNHYSQLYQVNGMEDHIHLLTDIHPTIRLADIEKDIKLASHSWIRETGFFPGFRGWQDSYAAFTCSFREKAGVASYIQDQKQHHCRETFTDEFERLLLENGVPYDERYLR